MTAHPSCLWGMKTEARLAHPRRASCVPGVRCATPSFDTAIAEHWRTMRRIQARAPLAVVLAVRARMDMLIDRRRS